jgi:hypothetical protein
VSNPLLAGLLQPHADTATEYADAILQSLQDIRDAVATSAMDRTVKTQRRIAAAAAGTGQVLVDLGMVPSGATWVITRLAVQGSPNTRVRLWLDAVGGTLSDKVALDADGDYADLVGESPIISEGRRIVAEFLGQTAAQVCNVFLQVDHHTEVPTRTI